MTDRLDPSKIALRKARGTLERITSEGSISGRRPKFFYFQLCDAFRLGWIARETAERGMTSKVFTAVAVEVLARRVIEQAILCSYIAATEGSEVIDRFLKTSASEFQRSWQEEHTEEHLTEDASLPVKQLPNYQQMAASRPQLYELYQRFSYLSHPRGAYPYSAAERDNRRRGTSFQEYYRLRCEVALASLAESINVIREIFEAEYAVWSQDSLGRA